MCLNRSDAECLNVLQGSLRACRALASFSLPLSAGLSRRPVLLRRNLVTQELEIAANAFLLNSWASSDAWRCDWYPQYDSARPQPLWQPLYRPREPDSLHACNQAVGSTRASPLT